MDNKDKLNGAQHVTGTSKLTQPPNFRGHFIKFRIFQDIPIRCKVLRTKAPKDMMRANEFVILLKLNVIEESALRVKPLYIYVLIVLFRSCTIYKHVKTKFLLKKIMSTIHDICSGVSNLINWCLYYSRFSRLNIIKLILLILFKSLSV